MDYYGAFGTQTRVAFPLIFSFVCSRQFSYRSIHRIRILKNPIKIQLIAWQWEDIKHSIVIIIIGNVAVVAIMHQQQPNDVGLRITLGNDRLVNGECIRRRKWTNREIVSEKGFGCACVSVLWIECLAIDRCGGIKRIAAHHFPISITTNGLRPDNQSLFAQTFIYYTKRVIESDTTSLCTRTCSRCRWTTMMTMLIALIWPFSFDAQQILRWWAECWLSNILYIGTATATASYA